MTMIKALEKALAEAPEGMEVYVTVSAWYGKEIAPWTEEIETVIEYARATEFQRDIEKSREENRWKVGRRIPNIDLPGYTQYIYRMLGDPEIIHVYVDPMTLERMAERQMRNQQKEKVARAISRQPENVGKKPQWWRWKK